MPSWMGPGSVVAGMAVTTALTGVTLVLLPLVGILTGQLVGNWIPIWFFALPVILCPAVGGGTAGYLHGTTPRRASLLGAIAAALGLAVIGVVVGLFVLLFMLGMTPAHAPVDHSRAVSMMMGVGGGTGLVVGTVLGAIGGIGGFHVRQ